MSGTYSRLPGIFSAPPEDFALLRRSALEQALARDKLAPKTPPPQKPKQVNRNAEKLEVDRTLEAARRFADKMPPKAAQATIAGMMSTLEVAEKTANRLATTSPQSKQDLARFQSQLAKLWKSIPDLAAAVTAYAALKTPESDAELARFGQRIESFVLALNRREDAAGIETSPHFKLKRALRDIVRSAEPAENAAGDEWLKQTIETSAALREKWIARGRFECVRVIDSHLDRFSGSAFYLVRACQAQLEAHLASKDVRSAGLVLETLARLVDVMRADKGEEAHVAAPQDPRSAGQSITPAQVEAIISELTARVEAAKLEPAIEGSHLPWVDRGNALIPEALFAKARLVKKIERSMEDLRFELRRLANAPPKYDLKKRELIAELHALREKTKVPQQEALMEMVKFRNSLFERSRLSKSDADELAMRIRADKTIDDKELPVLFNASSEVVRITGGRGLAAIHEFRRTKPRASTGHGTVNVGKKVQANVVWHEMAHHFELAVPGLKEAALSWVLSRASSKEPQKFSELYPEWHAITPFDDHEVGYRGKFPNPYSGRVYEEEGMTEVISTGMECFADAGTMLRFMNRDPEHFALIVGALAS